jgi:hypothetical protein
LNLYNFTTKTVLEFYPARRLSFASASARSLGALSHEPNLNPARQLSFASASARSLGARSREPNLNCHRSRPAPRARRSARSRHLSCSLSLALLCCSCSCSRSPACSPPRLRPLATSLASVAPLALARPRISPQAASVRPSASEIRPHVHKQCARTVCQKASKFDLPTGPPFCLAAFWRVLGGGQSRTKSSRQKNTQHFYHAQCARRVLLADGPLPPVNLPARTAHLLRIWPDETLPKAADKKFKTNKAIFW